MLKVGDSAQFSKTITETDISLFAGITGDFNSVHVNEEMAKKTKFGKRIAHGILTAGLISTVLGMYYPGPGTIYLSQNLNFLKPVYIGDTITAIVNLIQVINKEAGIYKLETICQNQNNVIVLSGEAIVQYKE